ncbi:exostosin family protein [Phormidesmis sp. 146-35]
MRKKVRFVILDFEFIHYDYYKDIQRALSEKGVDCTIQKVAGFEITRCNSINLKHLKQSFRKEENEVIVFIPDTTELYLKEPDLSIMFSGYRSWCDATRLKIIPHIWTPNSGTADIEALQWKHKPALSIGFMGNSYEHSGGAKLAAYLPTFLKEKFVQGWPLRYLEFLLGPKGMRLPVLFFPCIARIEALRNLEASNLPLDIVRKGAFVPDPKDAEIYRNHLLNNTYVLCPRGVENYSFRFYETLSWGRVPVLIDTDMMLPPHVDWDEVCIRVPYSKLDQLETIIRKDYETTSEAAFIERQSRSLALMKELREKNWLHEITEQIFALT